jgi:hypothetical protein
MNMHQIELGHAPELERALELQPPERLAHGPDLGRGEQPRMRHLREHFADDRLGIAVHWRGIDHRAATLEKSAQHGNEPRRGGSVRRDVERDPAAHTDDRKHLARRRNAAHERRAALCEDALRPER